MLLNAATFIACLALLLIFRRMDRANVRIMKLKRFADKTMHDFKDHIAGENRKFSDATIEMDLLLKKSGSLTDSIRTSLVEVESKLKGIDAEKTNLKKVEDDLKSVIDAAHDLNAQLKYIDNVKSNFGDLNKRAAQISESIAKLEKEQTVIVNAFNDQIRTRAHELSESLGVEVARLKESVSSRENKLVDDSRVKIDALVRSFSDSLVKLEESVSDTGGAILESVKLKIEGLERNVDAIELRIDSSKERVAQELTTKIETLSTTIRQLEADLAETRGNAASAVRSEVNAIVGKVEKAEADVVRICDKLRSVEDNINESRMRLIESFEEEQNKLRNNMDEFSISAIAKKD
ncbi:MAG TPA: hypothetical protein PKK43_09040, partial [Spirochaetota bacterium]|nr:hypothetical protein [Spirochaetota bacterium]